MQFFWQVNRYFSLRDIPKSLKLIQTINWDHLSGICGNDIQDVAEVPSNLANGLVGIMSVPKLNILKVFLKS
jgi:hypothetical protein